VLNKGTTLVFFLFVFWVKTSLASAMTYNTEERKPRQNREEEKEKKQIIRTVLKVTRK